MPRASLHGCARSLAGLVVVMVVLAILAALPAPASTAPAQAAPAVRDSIRSSASRDSSASLAPKAPAHGGSAHDAVPALVDRLSSRVAAVRDSAVYALWHVGPPAIPALAVAFRSADSLGRVGAIRALAGIRDSASATLLFQALDGSDARAALEAADGLRNFGGLALRPLLWRLTDPKPMGWAWAAYVLEGSGPRALGLLIRDRHQEALDTLMAIRAADQLDALFVLLSPPGGAASGGSRGTATVRPGAASSVIGLLVAMLEFDYSEGWDVAVTLGGFGDPAFAPLVQALHAKPTQARVGAAVALGISRDARAFDVLTAALADREPSVTVAAASALRGLHDPRLLRSVSALPRDLSESARVQIAAALAELGDSLAIPGLMRDVEREQAGEAENLLLRACEAHDTTLAEGAAAFFIRRGESGSELVLNQALDVAGDPRIAEMYLGCGNALLVRHAQRWAEVNKRELRPVPPERSSTRVAWRSAPR